MSQGIKELLDMKEDVKGEQALYREIKKIVCKTCYYKECKVCPIARHVENMRQRRQLISMRMSYLRKNEVSKNE